MAFFNAMQEQMKECL